METAGLRSDTRPVMSSLPLQIGDPPHSLDIADFSEIPWGRGKIRMTRLAWISLKEIRIKVRNSLLAIFTLKIK
jgi:hypothetical protein